MFSQRTDILWHDKSTVHKDMTGIDTTIENVFDHGSQQSSSFCRGLVAPLECTAVAPIDWTA